MCLDKVKFKNVIEPGGVTQEMPCTVPFSTSAQNSASTSFSADRAEWQARCRLQASDALYRGGQAAARWGRHAVLRRPEATTSGTSAGRIGTHGEINFSKHQSDCIIRSGCHAGGSPEM